MNVCCLFEKSGTFKNELIKLGHSAIDIDIISTEHTNFCMDLFNMIDNNFSEFLNQFDLIIAFFPCTWFSNQNDLIYNKKLPQFKKWNDEKINDYLNNRNEDYKRARHILIQLILQCKKPLIIENPKSRRIQEILGTPQLYIPNRILYGDKLRKPTYFYCYNGVSINMKIIDKNRIQEKDINHMKKNERSLIEKRFAKNFCEHITIERNV